MNQDQKNLEIALEQLQLEKLEKKHLQNEIKRLKHEIYVLNNPPTQTSDTMNPHRLNAILQEADEAMNRYNAKLRKETAKYAKQKQSKG